MPPENNQQPTTPNPQPDPKYQIKQIRTFQGDVANALSRQKESLVSIQQGEVLKRRATGMPHPEEADKEARKKRGDFLFLFLGSIFFIVVGVVGAWYGYKTILERTAPPIIAVPESRFITPNEEVVLNATGLDRLGFGSAFETHVSLNGENELIHVVVRKVGTESSPLLTTSELMALLESRAPGSLVRAFDDVFMTGALGESRFLILKLASFENAFAGMLSWEENIAEDLTPILANGLTVKAIAPGSVFKDVIVRNKDVRVLEHTVDSANSPQASTTEGTFTEFTETVLLYSFFDNNMLIITDSIETLQSLIERLARERLSR